jgi:hypothetical protein
VCCSTLLDYMGWWAPGCCCGKLCTAAENGWRTTRRRAPLRRLNTRPIYVAGRNNHLPHLRYSGVSGLKAEARGMCLRRLNSSYAGPTPSFTKGFGTGRQKMDLERWTNPKLSRRTCSSRCGLQSCRGNIGSLHVMFNVSAPCRTVCPMSWWSPTRCDSSPRRL